MNGKVWLVGAGPGDPELISVRGLRLIQQADVIVHDRLVAPQLIAEANAKAEIINVGKAPTKKRYPQNEINRILVEQAQLGRNVVRLKGGDPFVFGLGGDEIAALVAAGIAFEVVPGVSSALAAPAYAGIPVTHRGLASSLVVLAGHSLQGDEWAHLPTSGTIVVLMGVKKLREIVEKVLVVRAVNTPVALIQSGTTAAQKTVVGTLGTIVEIAAEIAAPATIVIGEVVELREQIGWIDEAESAEKVWGDAVKV